MLHMFYLVNIFHQFTYSFHMVVSQWSFSCTPGPHSMLVENSWFPLEEQRKMCGALCLRQQTARSYLSDSPTRKSSTHSTIITRNRSYVNHRLRSKIVILSLFCKTFACTTLNGVRGNGRDQFSLTERPSVIEELLKKTLNGVWGKIATKFCPRL